MAKTKKKDADPPVRDWPAIRAFRHLLRAQAAVVEAHKQFLTREHDLTMAEFDMLAELGNTQGRRMGDLAKQMITSPANVTRIAARLEKRGWVQRRRAADSDREVVASLTAEGELFFADNFREVVGFTREVMRARLSDEELDTLAKLCARIHE